MITAVAVLPISYDFRYCMYVFIGRFHNALMLGDASERVKILEEVGQLSLAYLCAVTHNLTEQADRLREILEEKGTPLPEAHAG